MLQFVTDNTAPVAPAEQAMAAFRGGCRWVELSPSASLEKDAAELAERLKGEDVFMVIRDDVPLVDKLRVHGVVLSSPDPRHVAETREALGAHAVIGVEVADPAQAAALRSIDIDYILYKVPSDAAGAEDAWRGFVAAAAKADVKAHLVASGDFDPATAAALAGAGAAGVAVSAAIARAADPAGMAAAYLEALTD